MQIADGAVVHIHYTLTNGEGGILDSSAGGDPLGYIQGMGNIIPGLERVLAGKVSGDKLEVSIPPEEAYGLRNEALVQSVPRSAFEGIGEVQPGMRFQGQTAQGPRILTVIHATMEEVTVDANHPLAGQTLNFDVEVTSVRAATARELDHGHVHEAGDHDHG